MEWIIVLRGGTQFKVSQESAAALVAQVSRAAVNGSRISVESGVLVRVDDVLFVAPYAADAVAPRGTIRMSARGALEGGG